MERAVESLESSLKSELAQEVKSICSELQKLRTQLHAVTGTDELGNLHTELKTLRAQVDQSMSDLAGTNELETVRTELKELRLQVGSSTSMSEMEAEKAQKSDQADNIAEQLAELRAEFQRETAALWTSTKVKMKATSLAVDALQKNVWGSRDGCPPPDVHGILERQAIDEELDEQSVYDGATSTRSRQLKAQTRSDSPKLDDLGGNLGKNHPGNPGACKRSTASSPRLHEQRAVLSTSSSNSLLRVGAQNQGSLNAPTPSNAAVTPCVPSIFSHSQTQFGATKASQSMSRQHQQLMHGGNVGIWPGCSSSTSVGVLNAPLNRSISQRDFGRQGTSPSRNASGHNAVGACRVPPVQHVPPGSTGAASPRANVVRLARSGSPPNSRSQRSSLLAETPTVQTCLTSRR